ncbi:hypothetical protein D3C71_2029160 [compost metagenome]
MGHQQVLVAGVEVGQALAAQPGSQHCLPGGVDEHPGQEVLAQYRIVEPAVFFHRHAWVPGAKRLGVDAACAAVLEVAVGVVDLDSLQATGG